MTELTYKKQSTGCGPCILSPISHVYRTDMNLAFALSCIMAVVWLFCGKCEGTPGLVTNMHRRLRGYTVEDLVGREVKKRQQFDDYGHMRFGKREQFDDYGHMRFGRNHI